MLIKKIDQVKRIQDRCKICKRELPEHWDMFYCLRCDKIKHDAFLESQED